MTAYGLEAYRSHELSIEMRTSSGDVINIDLANKQNLSLAAQRDSNGSSAAFSFSSEQSFSFSAETNGIDAQDRKEIENFLKIAQPYLDNYFEGLGNSSAPANKIAQNIADTFAPAKQKGPETVEYAKSNIVDLFDNAINKVENSTDILDQARDLLEETLKRFERFDFPLYA